MENRKVTFTASTGYAGAILRETNKLKDLGLNVTDYGNEEELRNELNTELREWVRDNVTQSYELQGEDVQFYVSIGYVGTDIEETQSLTDLGLSLEDYETKEDLEEDLEDIFEDWVGDNLEIAWNWEN